MNFYLSVFCFISFFSANTLQSSNSIINNEEKEILNSTSSLNSNVKSLFEIAYISEINYNLMSLGSKTALDCMSYDSDSFPTVKNLIERIRTIHGSIAILVVPNLELTTGFKGMFEPESRVISIDKNDFISSVTYPATLMFELCNASNPLVLLGTARKFSLNEDHYAFFSEAVEYLSLVICKKIQREYLQYTLRNFLPGTDFYDYLQSCIEDTSDDIFINHWQELKVNNFKHIELYKNQFRRGLGISISPSLSKINDNDCQFLITDILSELSLDIAKKESEILKISI